MTSTPRRTEDHFTSTGADQFRDISAWDNPDLLPSIDFTNGLTTGEQSRLLERENEQEALHSTMARACAGHGGAVVICGDPGIGKTRLLAGAASAAERLGLVALRAAGSELERGFAFGAVQQLYERSLADLPVAERERILGGAASQARGVFPALCTGADGDAEVTEATHAVLHGLYWLTVNLAMHQPLLLSVDDAHWVDEPSLRWLSYLAHRLEDMPICLMIATRPPDDADDHEVLRELAARTGSPMVVPRPLSTAAVRELLTERMAREPDRDFAQACHEATAGNPFYLSELMTELERRGIEPTPTNVPELSAITPMSIIRSVALRLGQVAPESRRLAHAAAILSDVDQHGQAARLADLPADRVVAAAEQLERAGILDRGDLGFSHPLVRTAVYADIPLAERDELHVQAARLLSDANASPERAAAHLLRCQPRHQGWVVELLTGAARSARQAGAPGAAATYLQRALDEEPQGADRIRVLRELGQSVLAAEGLEGLRYLREARRLAPDPEAASDVSLELGLALFTQGFVSDAAAVFEEALAHARRHALDSEATLQAHLACVAVLDLRVLERMGGLKGAAHLVRSTHYRGGLAQAALSWVCAAGEPPAARAAELAEAALADRRLITGHDPLGLGGATMTLLTTDRLDRAKRVWDEIVASARARGALVMLRFALADRASVHSRMGDMSAAELDTREVLDWALELEIPLDAYAVALPWVVGPLVEALIERGALEEADEWMRLSLPESEVPPVLAFTILLATLGELRLAEGRQRDAVMHLRECGRRLQEWGIQNPGFVSWRSTLALALAAAGEIDEARQLCAEEVRLARRFEVPRALGVALTRSGSLSDADRDPEVLREAMDILDATPARLAQARARYEYGTALRLCGHRSAAREPLREALDLAIRCSATVLAGRVHAELVAAGAKPRRAALSGARALTPAEARVSRLAAQGLTNREVAEALFVTEKTVEGHLANAFRKLEIKSRAQLSAAID